jgi:Ca2+-binding EF-hand superfamily protein
VFISPAGEPFRAPPGSPYPIAEWFARADTNHDGLLTREEFVADSLTFFERLDTDHDGMIDGFEVSDYEQKVAPEILPRAAQFQEDRWGSLGGGLAGGGPGGRPGGPPGGGGGRSLFSKGAPKGYGVGRSGAGLYGLLNEVEPVSGSDSDLDHRVTRQEFARAAKMRFDLLDPGKTGALKLNDLPKTPLQSLLENPPKEKKRKKPPKRVEMRLQSSAATTP